MSKQSPWFLLALACFAALPPFAIDTYLPGIPTMAHFFHVREAQMLNTLSTYFFGFSLGIILWGPCSDRWGRRPILTMGMILYVLSTIASAFSTDIHALEFFRCTQAFADSTGVITAFAMARDCFAKEQLTRTLTTLTMIVMLAPTIAPLVGTILLRTHHWQHIFHFLSAYGVLLLILSRFMPETNQEKSHKMSTVFFVKQYFSHLRNWRFLILALCAGCSFGAFFSFVGSSSLIYMSIYHTDKLSFSLLFALNTFAIVLANFTVKKICHRFSLRQIQVMGCVIALLSTGFMLLSADFWPQQWFAFAATIFLTTYGICLVSSCLMSDSLNSVQHAFGTATSLINMLRYGCGAIASFLMGIFLSNTIKPLAWQQLVFISLILLLLGCFRLNERAID